MQAPVIAGTHIAAAAQTHIGNFDDVDLEVTKSTPQISDAQLPLPALLSTRTAQRFAPGATDHAKRVVLGGNRTGNMGAMAVAIIVRFAGGTVDSADHVQVRMIVNSRVDNRHIDIHCTLTIAGAGFALGHH